MRIYLFSPGKTFKVLLIFISGLLLTNHASAQFYNGSQMQFGKNRVQYDERFWSFYRYKNFETYYYVGGKELAEYTGSVAGKDIEEIEKLFDFALEGKIQYLIYNKLSDAKQSNVGLQNDDVQNNIGGYTRIVGNKVFVYFTGEHESFHRMIRAGTAKVLLDEIMYGGDVRERLQNAALLFMPEWYEKGLISYISYPWDTRIDNLVRDGVISKKMLKLNRLTGEQAMIAGHSMWRYIIETYGESSVSNLLYMTRLNRNIESGMQFVLGVSLKSLTDNWKEWLLAQYAESDKGRALPPGTPVIKKVKKDILYTGMHTSPDTRYTVFVTNDLGRYKIKLRNHPENKTKTILRGGYRSYSVETDASFPLMAWHPSGKLFAVIRERKGKLLLGTYTLETKKYEESELFNFEKVLDFSYSDDGQLLIMSAVQKGQSDIFVYNLRTRTYEQITKDKADDLNPRFFRGGTEIIFSSNRDNDTLNAQVKQDTVLPGSYDIFMYDYASKDNLLKRVTSTNGANEINPVPYDSMTIAYLGDNNGIYNRYLARIDSAISFIDTTEHYRYIIETRQQTDYSRNIITQDVNSSMRKLNELIYENGKYKMYQQDLKSWEETSIAAPVNTAYRNSSFKNITVQQNSPEVIQPKEGKEEKHEEVVPPDTSKIDINNYVFQSEFPKSKRKAEEEPEKTESDLKASAETKDTAKAAPIIKPRNYEIAFTADYVVTQVDNGLLNTTYQPFIAGGGGYYNPGLNGFLKLGISDLMEDFKITGGVRITADLNGSEYFLSYENLKKRLDKQLLFYRASQVNDAGLFYYRAKTHEVLYRVSWPFSEVSSVRGTIAYRNDRQVILSSDVNTLLTNDENKNWITPKLEYVFDNTVSPGLNLYYGTRLKVFGEYFKNVDEQKTDMYVVGADVRHYLKIHRQIIWANRIAGSASYGSQKIIFYMGGVDNWFNPKFDRTIPIDFSQNYAYQAVATPMRGFDQNIRNGNKFLIANSELRIPIFTYLLNRPVRSDFIRNFQVIGFADAGTAWSGPDPYDPNNSLNNSVVQVPPPYTVTVYYQREPIVAGYGFGLRSRVLGYFIRADWAWGYEDGVHLPQKFYLSFALDF
jgi:hypothetical protein